MAYSRMYGDSRYSSYRNAMDDYCLQQKVSCEDKSFEIWRLITKLNNNSGSFVVDYGVHDQQSAIMYDFYLADGRNFCHAFPKATFVVKENGIHVHHSSDFELEKKKVVKPEKVTDKFAKSLKKVFWNYYNRHKVLPFSESML